MLNVPSMLNLLVYVFHVFFNSSQLQEEQQQEEQQQQLLIDRDARGENKNAYTVLLYR